MIVTRLHVQNALTEAIIEFVEVEHEQINYDELANILTSFKIKLGILMQSCEDRKNDSN